MRQQALQPQTQVAAAISGSTVNIVLTGDLRELRSGKSQAPLHISPLHLVLATVGVGRGRWTAEDSLLERGQEDVEMRALGGQLGLQTPSLLLVHRPVVVRPQVQRPFTLQLAFGCFGARSLQ